MPCAATGEMVPASVLYPTAAEEQEVVLGRYPASLAPDAPVHGGPHPVVLVSHGTGSSPYLHRTLAAHLARRGFVAALVEHPRDDRDCGDLAGTATILRNRPLHLRAVLDHVLADGDLGSGVPEVGVGVVGHFSFLSPFPPYLVNPALPPSQDPPGFDRPVFFETFPDEVRRFLDRHLR